MPKQPSYYQHRCFDALFSVVCIYSLAVGYTKFFLYTSHTQENNYNLIQANTKFLGKTNRYHDLSF